MKDYQLLVVPVDFQVIVDTQFRYVAHPLLDLVQVQVRSQLGHGHLRVGKDAPALEVAVDNVFPHLEAAKVDFSPMIVIFRRRDSHELSSPSQFFAITGLAFIAVEAIVVGQLLPLTNKLPKGARMPKHVVEIVTRFVEADQGSRVQVFG